jgi:hypothetical protein
MPVKPADQVTAQAVSWLWHRRIPLGKLLILDGDPDLGKSLIALDLCARLSTGRPFPDGQPSSGPANSLVLSAEDNAADTVVPRLHRLGADVQRVFVWQREGDDEDWPWRFPAQVDRLDDALRRTEARLAVIDPIMAFLDDSVFCAGDQSVRRALAPLMQLAEKYRCSLLMHRHLTKKGGGRALYRGLGSIAFVAACRVAMIVARDRQTPDRCILAQVRGSLAGPQPSLAYRLTAADGELPVVDWLGVSSVSADELLTGAAPAELSQHDQAATFLQEFLAAGPRTAREIWEAAVKEDHSKRTLRRAKDTLGIRSRRVYDGKRPISYWLLPGQELPAQFAAENEWDRWMGEMEKQFPPRTPLEEDEDERPHEGREL